MAKKDLLDEVGLDDEEEFDLLDEIEEDDAEAWVPENPGDGVQGVILKIGETRSDFSDIPAPTITLETKEGNKVRVIAYSTVLRNEVNDAKLQPGDLFAVKYFGNATGKKGQTYKKIQIAFRRRQPA